MGVPGIKPPIDLAILVIPVQDPTGKPFKYPTQHAIKYHDGRLVFSVPAAARERAEIPLRINPFYEEIHAWVDAARRVSSLGHLGFHLDFITRSTYEAIITLTAWTPGYV